MAVKVGMAVAVGEFVGARVRVGLATAFALAVGETCGVTLPAQATKQNIMKSEHNVSRIISLLLFGGKCIDTVYCIFIYNRDRLANGEFVTPLNDGIGHTIFCECILER